MSMRQVLCRFRPQQLLKVQNLSNNVRYFAAAQTKATDPIQNLFLDKVREYAKLSKSTADGLVDATPESQKALHDELDKLARVFGATGPEFMNFPTFSFSDVSLEPVGVDVGANAETAEEAAVEEVEDEDKPYWVP